MVRQKQIAQMQKQTTITAQESLQVVRSLLRVSVFHVSYLRGLFDESTFKGVSMDNLEGMNIKMLLPNTPESQRLVEWVEKGVYDALKNNYLKTLIYGIATNAAGTSLLEEYKFSFSYGEEGVVTMNISGPAGSQKKGKKGMQSSQDCGYDSVKRQVITLMRLLVEICQTLEIVPDERYLFMKMQYHDNTPEEYQPPCFKAADPNAVGHFPHKPFAMSIGNLKTNHHSVGLKVISALDGKAQEEAEEFDKSEQQSNMFGGAEDDSDRETDEADKDEEDMECDDDAADGAGGNNGGGMRSSQEGTLEAVKAFCLKRSQVEVPDIMAAIVDVRASDLDTLICPALVAQGVLSPVPGRADTFAVKRGDEQKPAVRTDEAQRETGTGGTGGGGGSSVVQAPLRTPTDDAATAAAAAAAEMQELSVHPGDKYEPTQREEPQSALRKRAAPDSLDTAVGDSGGAGTAQTESGAKKADGDTPQRLVVSDAVSGRRGRLTRMAASSMECPPTAVLPEASQPLEGLHFESQQSMQGAPGRRPKVSINEQPIRQSKRLRATAGGGGGAGRC